MKIADEKAMIDRAQLRKMLEGFRLSRTKKRDIEIAQDLAELFRKKSWLRNVFLPFGMNRFDRAVKELNGLDFGSEDYNIKKKELRTMAETLERKLYSLKNLGRAAILAGGLALTAGSFPAYAQEATTQVEQKPFVMPSDDVLKQYMKTPVNELLKDIAVQVDDNNYNENASKLKAEESGAMIFFHGDDDLSRNLGVTVNELNKQFPTMKLVSYDCGYGQGVRRTAILQMIEQLKKKGYPITEIPCVLFYINKNGKVDLARENDGTDINANGGPNSKSMIKDWINFYIKKISEVYKKQ